MVDKPLILLTGATGYVGGRLKRLLEKQHYPLRCLVRSDVNIPDDKPDSTQYIVGDASDKKILLKALEGVDVAFYLVHSLGASGEWACQLAAQFAQCASNRHVKRVIYLGCLGGNYDEELSPHLKLRHEIGNILRANADKMQVIEFRASIVLGAGSVSFEMIRTLVDRLPIMITPKWVNTPAQPISIDNLLSYLYKSIEFPLENNPIFEIGGKEQVSYGDLIKEYAAQKGLKRWIINAPVLAPWLSSMWLGLVTPIYARVGRKLVESACCPTVVHDPLASSLFHIPCISPKEAIQKTIENSIAESRWNDSISCAYSPKCWEEIQFGERFVDERTATVQASLERAFQPICQLGCNKKCYYSLNWVWWLRGSLDLLLGGVGMRRGRRDFDKLQKGDVIDFWRVETYKPNHYLKLACELKMPGRSWLEFQVDPCKEGSRITQRLLFDPAGVVGIIYWYFLYPARYFVFTRMLRAITKSIREVPCELPLQARQD